MKKLCLLLALVLLLAPAVRADVIYIPEDDFYVRHDCDSVNRGYLASGPEGEVILYRSPESPSVEGRIPNGNGVWIYGIYTAPDGTQWGYTENLKGFGWAPMAYLTLRYDHQCFVEEFGDRIVELDQYLQVEAEAVVYLWDYPGSEGCEEWPTEEGEYLPEYAAYFIDDGGRRWGHITYHYGIRNVWVCLDDPAADYDTLYADIPAQTVTLPQPPDSDTIIEPARPGMGAVLLAVAAVAVGSGVFLWLTRKKKS